MNKDDLNSKLSKRAMQIYAKAMNDNNTNEPTAKQEFEAALALYPLEPDDERWYALTAVLLYAID